MPRENDGEMPRVAPTKKRKGPEVVEPLSEMDALARVAEMDNLVRNGVSEIKRLEDEIGLLSAKLRSATQLEKVLTENLEKERKAFRDLRLKMNESIEHTLTIHKESDARKKENAELRKQVDQLNNQLLRSRRPMTRKEEDKVYAELVLSRERIVKLEKQIQQTTALQDILECVGSIRTSVLHLKDGVGGVRSEVNKLNDRLVGSAQGSLESLQIANSELRAAHFSALDEIEVQTKVNRKLRQRLDLAESRAESLETELGVSNKLLGDARREIEELAKSAHTPLSPGPFGYGFPPPPLPSSIQPAFDWDVISGLIASSSDENSPVPIQESETPEAPKSDEQDVELECSESI